MSNSVQFFLGANTPNGFYSLFNQLYDPYDDWKMYIIKGGPGTGKSSLMKSVAREAEKNGYSVERVPCSSDPLSLDGIIINDLKVAIADGTAPHIIDPIFPGVCEQIINLGNYWDSNKLNTNKDKIRRITIKNSEEHKKCIKSLKAAQLLSLELNALALDSIDVNKIDRFIIRTTDKIFGKTTEKTFTEKTRFLSALTPIGIVTQYDTFNSQCDNVYVINDELGNISSYILNSLIREAKNKKVSYIKCSCPIDPTNKIDHVIFPDIKTGIFTSNEFHPYIGSPFKVINCTRFIDSDKQKAVENKIRYIKKTRHDMIGESLERLKAAKTAHDVLESYYIASMDFEGVAYERDRIISEIFN